MKNRRVVGDAVVHAQHPKALWQATLCGLRMSPYDRAHIQLVPCGEPVDCMTCLVVEARTEDP